MAARYGRWIGVCTFESKEDRVMAKAWKGEMGHCMSIVNSSFATRPNCAGSNHVWQGLGFRV